MRNAFYFILNAFFVLEIFKFLYIHLPLFFPVGHSFKSWRHKLSKQELNNTFCLISSEGKKNSYDIETLSICRVLNKEHFYGKIMQKLCSKS